MIITQNPPEICNAYNDIIMIFEKDVTDGDTATLDIIYQESQPDEATYSLSREFLNIGGSEIAKFNFSYLIRKLFVDTIDNFFGDDVPPLYIDRMLYVEPFIEYYSGGNIISLNSVMQSGSPFLLDTNNVFLSKSTRLKKYEGYPLSVSFLKNNSPSSSPYVYCWVDGSVVEFGGSAYFFGANPHVSIQIEDDTDLVEFRDASTEPYSARVVINIDHPCTPPQVNALYLRWIDGGDWQYHMFDRRHFINQSVDTGDTFLSNESTATTILMSEKRLNVTAEKSIDTGADNLDLEEYTKLSFIPFSPTIQMYDLDNDTWIEIIPSGDNSNTYDSGSSLQSVRLSFNVPQLTQF